MELNVEYETLETGEELNKTKKNEIKIKWMCSCNEQNMDMT